MESHEEDEVGPIDMIVIGYPVGAPMTGEAMPIFLDLVDRGIIRVLDALFVLKAEDGSSRASTPPTWTSRTSGTSRPWRALPPACSAATTSRPPARRSIPGPRRS